MSCPIQNDLPVIDEKATMEKNEEMESWWVSHV